MKIGLKLPIYKIKIDAKKYRRYNRLIGEINPIHLSKKYAQNAGYKTIIIAGNYLFTYIPMWLIDWTGNVENIKNITIRFDTPVYPDDEIVHEGEVKEITESINEKIVRCNYSIRNTSGEITAIGEIILSF